MKYTRYEFYYHNSEKHILSALKFVMLRLFNVWIWWNMFICYDWNYIIYETAFEPYNCAMNSIIHNKQKYFKTSPLQRHLSTVTISNFVSMYQVALINCLCPDDLSLFTILCLHLVKICGMFSWFLQGN